MLVFFARLLRGYRRCLNGGANGGGTGTGSADADGRLSSSGDSGSGSVGSGVPSSSRRHTSIERLVDIEALAERHDGRVVYLKQEHRFDERAPETLKQSDGHWFWSTLKLSRPIYRDVILASILINLFAVASPLFVMNAYDKVVPNLAFNTLWVLATGMAIIMVFDFVMRQTRAYFMDTAGKKSEVLLTSKLFSKTMNLRMEARPGSGRFELDVIS